MSLTQDSLHAPLAPRSVHATPHPSLIGIGPIRGEDLQLFADHLAETFEFEAAAARLAEVAWYQERVGAEVCSLIQASELRERTIAACEQFAAAVRLMLRVADEDRMACLVDHALAEVARKDVKDAPENRARRAAFYGNLARQVAPVVEAAVDEEFEQRMRTRWWAERDDAPAGLLDGDPPDDPVGGPLIEPDDLRGARGIFWSFLGFVTICLMGMAAVAIWAVVG